MVKRYGGVLVNTYFLKTPPASTKNLKAQNTISQTKQDLRKLMFNSTTTNYVCPSANALSAFQLGGHKSYFPTKQKTGGVYG